MGLMNWFSASRAQQFGDEMAQLFMKRVPLQTAIKEKDFRVKANKTLTVMTTRVREFQLEHKLNVYQKAKFGNRFKWVLLDAGYNEAYAGELTEWMLLHF